MKILKNITLTLLITSTLSCAQKYPILPYAEKTPSPVVSHNENLQDTINPLMLGLIPPKFIGSKKAVTEHITDIDELIHKKHSLIGIFTNLESPNPAVDIPTQLEHLFKEGYTPFFNLMSNLTAREIASGKINSDINELALSFKSWLSNNPGKKPILSILPEMNGFWETYGQTPEDYKNAYALIQSLFNKTGIKRSDVYWAFSPNGWSYKGHEFEKYYPGDNVVDIVGFSSYNFGFCDVTQWKRWYELTKLNQSYIDRFTAITKKPIIIAQMASTAMTENGISLEAKDQWLIDNYMHLANQDQVIGVMYFNIDKECDWAIYQGNNRISKGYQKATQETNIIYVSPEQLHKLINP